KRAYAPARASMGTGSGLVVDAELAEPDPTGEALKEAIALRHPAQRRGGARRQQAEIAGVLRDFLTCAPIDERIKALDGEAQQRRLVFPMCLGGIDDVVTAIEPVCDQFSDQRRRVLPVGVHKQYRTVAGVIEPGKQRRFLAEIARQRYHL